MWLSSHHLGDLGDLCGVDGSAVLIGGHRVPRLVSLRALIPLICNHDNRKVCYTNRKRTTLPLVIWTNQVNYLLYVFSHTNVSKISYLSIYCRSMSEGVLWILPGLLFMSLDISCWWTFLCSSCSSILASLWICSMVLGPWSALRDTQLCWCTQRHQWDFGSLINKRCLASQMIFKQETPSFPPANCHWSLPKLTLVVKVDMLISSSK